MKMKTFMASVRTDTPITLISCCFEPIIYDQAADMQSVKKVRCFESGELAIIASEFFSRVTLIDPDYDERRLVVYVA